MRILMADSCSTPRYPVRSAVRSGLRLWSPIAILCVSFTPAQTQTDSRPLVTIDSGALEGAHFGTAPNEVMFLGIPYASPPTGERRWKPPQPVVKWQGARKANSYGAACPQAEDPKDKASRQELAETFEAYFTYRTNEDCLYLNVWTTSLHASAKKPPVMFWIHGGGNVSGASQVVPMGPALARKGVVLVSINYRLGALGFLAHPALTAESTYHSSGNYGILDQIAALHKDWALKILHKASVAPQEPASNRVDYQFRGTDEFEWVYCLQRISEERPKQ